MRESLLGHLACPACKCRLALTVAERNEDEIVTGTMACSGCAATYPIVRGVPRFCARDNYTASFGFQWNQFSRTQIDSLNGSHASRDRFLNETRHTSEWMRGRVVLDAGCGAGRFLDVARHECGTLIGVDFSDAVDASYALTHRDPHVHVVQASIYELPFVEGHFDGVYSIGVIQHTPDPRETVRKLIAAVKPGGMVAITMYERKPWTRLNAKYLVRPITRRIPPRLLHALLVATMPLLFPLTFVLFRVPKLGKFFSFAIPVVDYSRHTEMSIADQYRAVLLDTFDMLSPAFDQPLSKGEVDELLAEARMIEIVRNRFPGGSGINVVARKRSVPAAAGDH